MVCHFRIVPAGHKSCKPSVAQYIREIVCWRADPENGSNRKTTCLSPGLTWTPPEHIVALEHLSPVPIHINIPRKVVGIMQLNNRVSTRLHTDGHLCVPILAGINIRATAIGENMRDCGSEAIG
jgi:hypothetical protein